MSYIINKIQCFNTLNCFFSFSFYIIILQNFDVKRPDHLFIIIIIYLQNKIPFNTNCIILFHKKKFNLVFDIFQNYVHFMYIYKSI